ncbi:MAG TPA: protein kinase, partial [Bacteroidota bacterium]
MIGQTISHYKILEKLGEGGMGVVYKAEDIKLKRTVALKFLPHHLTSTKEEEARFLQEAQAAATLNHPNVCTIFAVEEHEGQQFIAMEYVDGVTLRQRMENAPLKLNQAISYAVQVGEALQEAHNKGIVHRDIKADNIMVNAKNQVKVMDFGLAKLKGSLKLTRSSSTVGTLAYMAPEQVQGGEVDARSDNFSFGVVLYEMLTGRTPFRGEHDAAMMYSIINEEPEPLERYLSESSPELQRILSRALEKDPDDRYQSAADMVSELRRLQKQTSRVSRKPLEEMKTSQTPASVEREPRAPAVEEQPEEVKKIPAGIPTPTGKARIIAYSGIALAVLAVGALAVNLLFFRTEAVRADKKSIAVLPFKNLSEEKESEFFSDGITEDIITQLSKIGDLRVISRTSVMRYKESDKSIRDIGKELGVATILEGSVRRAGNQVRIVAQLIDASNDEHLWADTYDRELTQIFAIQSDIAQKIASSLKAKLTSSQKQQIEKKPTENLDAYTFYLKGREYYYRYHKQENENAVQLFKNALDLDPNYALAYAGLGDAYGQRVQRFGFAEGWLDSAVAVTDKAISIDPNLAEAYKA